jgi:hypothetical protein
VRVGDGVEAGEVGGGGDGPGAGGWFGGPAGGGAVEVFAAHHGSAQRPFGGVVVQGQQREVAVSGEAVPFTIEGRQYFRGAGL